MHQANAAGQPWHSAQEYYVLAVLRALQLHLDDEKARSQVVTILAIGGHTAVHRNSQQWNIGWERLSWTD
eukprot:4802462-Pyramimonas_sp.AAC.1